MTTPEEWRVLLSAYVDDELEPAERREIEERVKNHPELARELKELETMRGITSGMRLREFPDAVWDRYVEGTYNRLERRVGWILLSLGAMVLIGYGLYELVVFLVAAEEIAWWVKAAIGAVCVGLAVLSVSVIRERLFAWKRDPYRDVKR